MGLKSGCQGGMYSNLYPFMAAASRTAKVVCTAFEKKCTQLPFISGDVSGCKSENTDGRVLHKLLDMVDRPTLQLSAP